MRDSGAVRDVVIANGLDSVVGRDVQRSRVEAPYQVRVSAWDEPMAASLPSPHRSRLVVELRPTKQSSSTRCPGLRLVLEADRVVGFRVRGRDEDGQIMVVGEERRTQ
jgi:hypothetical protein